MSASGEKKGVKDDEIFANKLQYEECFEHYKKNKMCNQANRNNIEKSLPLIKSYQNEYSDYMKKIQERRDNEIEETDAALALEIQKAYIKELECEKIIQQIRDRELAKRLQEKEILIDIGAGFNDNEGTLVAEKNQYYMAGTEQNEQAYIEKLKKEQEDLKFAKYLQQQEEKQLISECRRLNPSTNESREDVTNFNLVSRIQKRLNLNQTRQPALPKTPTPKISQSNANLNKLIHSALNNDLPKQITVSCKNLNRQAIRHDQETRSRGTRDDNKSVINHYSRSISQTPQLAESLRSSLGSKSASSSTSSLNSSSIESSPHQQIRQSLPNDNIQTNTAIKNIYSESSTTKTIFKPNSLATTIHKLTESSNTNYLNNRCEIDSGRKVVNSGKIGREGEKQRIIMDFDCNPANYMSSFKNGQLMEEENLISVSDFENPEFGSKSSSEPAVGHTNTGNKETFSKHDIHMINKKEFAGEITKCSLLSNQEDKVDLNLLVQTKNIVAAIDPTFQNKVSFESEEIDLEKDKMNRARDYDSLENDTDMFLPVQGQKRGTVKNNLKKKKSQSQCLQQ